MTYRSVFRADLFTGQNIIVTGGGSGIGRCIAHELASLGAHVILIGRTLAKLETVAAEIEGDGGKCSFHSQDIRDEDGVTDTVKAIVTDHGRIHGLVNNAGGQYPAPLATISKKGFDTVVASNLVGGFLMAREVFTQSMADHGGAIVNMLADMWRGMPIMGHSGAARSGMENLTKTAAIEWAVAGVRVNAVAPGWVASSGMDKYDGAINGVFPKLRHAVPLKRIGREAEVSSAVTFLLSEGASFITGDTIRIDGGAPQMTTMWPIPDHDRSTPYEGFHRADLPEILKDTDNK
jgi:citronellol/citronellal dehydrogenase